MAWPEALVRARFAAAGVPIDGEHPWAIQVRDARFFRELLARGSLGLGEAYVAGVWEAERLDETIRRLLAANLDRIAMPMDALRRAALATAALWRNRQGRRGARAAASFHYDAGNALFRAMLGPSMVYSCGYWRAADNLDDAQAAKLDLICRKLDLAPGQRLLDIGCGWGSLAAHAARRYGVEVLGVTLSREQQTFAARRTADLPVTIRLQDYRDVRGRFDRIVSVGMFEHVGPRNYRAFFDTAAQLLADDGLLLLHTIGRYDTTAQTDAWIDRHVFPGGKLPSAAQIAAAIERRFVFEDWHNFGPDYDRTLTAWWENLRRAWEPQGFAARCGEAQLRRWRYYLLACAGFFRARHGQLWQVVLCKHSRRARYRRVV
ncbi:cyclopropane-fatty-acyl-phospholipid synthase [Thiohalocapsa halophila]|uniref:Cyclopropane-fatty-acyl-phospholipid synthase n=2 Tax=Thiohalocapsa halophila TaxID=69359 RepID=A0ABS1CL42_9GAMM|nr:cyclopropane-fatty-acyl-phospholipid synthase [Thiohalocapsa halophila]